MLALLAKRMVKVEKKENPVAGTFQTDFSGDPK